MGGQIARIGTRADVVVVALSVGGACTDIRVLAYIAYARIRGAGVVVVAVSGNIAAVRYSRVSAGIGRTGIRRAYVVVIARGRYSRRVPAYVAGARIRGADVVVVAVSDGIAAVRNSWV